LVDHLSFLILGPDVGPRAAVEAIEAAGSKRKQFATS